MKKEPMNWTKAKSLSDLSELTAQWLLGLVVDHPCHFGPPDDETKKITQTLVRMNRSGLMTDTSQPGKPFHDGNAQRACFSGFCEEVLAMAVASLTLSTDLIVLVFPPDSGGGYQIPITLEDYHPFTWHGSYDEQVVEPFGQALGIRGINALRMAWYVVVIDPVWGRQRYIWQQVEKVINEGAAPFDTRPYPDHNLDVDFYY